MDMIADNGAYAVLATPSGARPAWMARKYPEVLRVRPDRGRNLFGRRHNHCLSSPVYREKVWVINSQLAERYRDHPALLVWHLSNEYNGDCHCDLCRAHSSSGSRPSTARWTPSTRPGGRHSGATPTPIGHRSSRPARSARPPSTASTWTGSVSSPTRPSTSCKHEIAALRQFTPDMPVTTNIMGTFPGLNYWKLAEPPGRDLVGQLPTWHKGDDVALGLGDRLRPRHQPLSQGRQALYADGERAQRHQLDARRQAQATRACTRSARCRPWRTAPIRCSTSSGARAGDRRRSSTAQWWITSATRTPASSAMSPTWA